MKSQLYFNIAIRIIILFIIMMFATYLPEHLREFFGDSLKSENDCSKIYIDIIDKRYNWGTRHYLYFYMMILLCVLSIINFIISTFRLIKKYYPNVSIF